MRHELQTALIAAQTIPSPELPRLLGELEEVRCTALARLSSPAAVQRPDELLTIEQASERLGMSAHYLYRHSDSLPFVRRLGRSLRFSANGISEYINRKGRK